jgi:hypothetical protein
MGNTADHETDFYGWAMEQTRLLRAGRLAEADVANIAEEIESIGRSEKRELVSRLAALLLHLLKWQYQPGLRGRSWASSVAVQRREIARHLDENPSLRPTLADVMASAYDRALDQAEIETGRLRDMFPWSCPYTFEQVMDAEFWPDEA